MQLPIRKVVDSSNRVRIVDAAHETYFIGEGVSDEGAAASTIVTATNNYERTHRALAKLVETIGTHDIACKALGAFDPTKPPNDALELVNRTYAEFQNALVNAMVLL